MIRAPTHRAHWIFPAILALLFAACKPSVPTGQTELTPAPAVRTPTPAPTPLPPRKLAIWKEFDPARCLITARRLVSFGPRTVGSAAIQQARELIRSELTSATWRVEEQRFQESDNQNGTKLEFVNLVAHSAKVSLGRPHWLVAAHYDSLRLGIATDPGASDGAANTAVLLEVARVTSADLQLSSTVEFVFLDGHMPRRQITSTDGLFGSRWYSQLISIQHRAQEIRGMLALERLGDAHSRLSFAPNSDPTLQSAVQSAAKALGWQISAATRPFLLDHAPYREIGVPSLALLDSESVYFNTADDVAERLDPGSLAQAGQLVLHFLSEESFQKPTL